MIRLCKKVPSTFSTRAANGVHRVVRWRGFWLGSLFLLGLLQAQAETIAAFERLSPPFVAQIRQLTMSHKNGSDDGQQTVVFTAFGQSWRWQVSPNRQLLAQLPPAQKKTLAEDISLWKGHDKAHPERWIRFSLWRDPRTGETQLHGMWWDGRDFYLIKPVSGTPLEKTFAARGWPQSSTVAYRLADVISQQSLACGVDGNHDFSPGYQGLLSDLHSAVKNTVLPSVATQQLNVAIVADTFYQNWWGANTTNSILNLMNNVDGIYNNQIGVAVVVSQLVMLTDNAGMTATDSGVLLEQFRDWVGAGNLNNPGLAHLFTSRNLDGNIKGRAWLGVLCAGRWGTGIDEIVGNSYETIIVAHEMGHNFGADHDGDANGSCPNEPINTYIMSPSVTASYTNFSPCSANVLVNAAASASCLLPLGPDLIFLHGFE